MIKSKVEAIKRVQDISKNGNKLADIKTLVEEIMDLGVRDHQTDQVVRATLAGLEK